MKKTTLSAILIFLLGAYVYPQSNKTENVKESTVKGRGNALDTIVRRKTALSVNSTYQIKYTRDERIANLFSPYLVKDIVSPGDHSHSVYLRRVKEAMEILPKAKSELVKRMKTSSTFKERLEQLNINNEADINSINFVHFPVYYVTPNVVNFRDGENFANYYNLSRGILKYLMLRNNKLIGFLDVNNDKGNFTVATIAIHPFELESYNEIVRLGKVPIGIKQSVSTSDKVGAGHIKTFGYMDQGHLVLSLYSQATVKNIGGVASEPVFIKFYSLETAEHFFSGKNGSSPITSWLENYAKNLEKRLN